MINYYYKNDLQRRLIFFLWVGQRITRSYKWSAVTTASDPPLEKYFQGRVTPSSSLANMHHFQERIIPSPPLKMHFQGAGDGMARLYKWSHAKKNYNIFI